MSTEPCRCGASKVDVHAHFLPECYAAALAKAGVTTLDGGFPIPAWNAEAALAMMDRHGIGTAMISLSSPAAQFLPIENRARLCREVNEAGVALLRHASNRFGYFAVLPLPDIAASLAEIEHVFDRLGADGVTLQSNIDGIYLGSPAFAPIFAELDRRRAVLFLHPTSPACAESLTLGRPAPLLEFPLDTTRSIVDLLYHRTLQTHPGIRVIVPHGGAALPALAARIAAFANLPFLQPRPASEAEVFEALAALYYDVALSADPVTLAGLRRIAPIGQILFGSDWPFTPEFGVARNIARLEQSELLSASDARAIARENAERLFPRLGMRN